VNLLDCSKANDGKDATQGAIAHKQCEESPANGGIGNSNSIDNDNSKPLRANPTSQIGTDHQERIKQHNQQRRR